VGEILETFGIESEESVAIGDSSGDIEMFKRVGFSVAFNSACSELDQIANVCVRSENLADIIPHLAR